MAKVIPLKLEDLDPEPAKVRTLRPEDLDPEPGLGSLLPQAAAAAPAAAQATQPAPSFSWASPQPIMPPAAPAPQQSPTDALKAPTTAAPDPTTLGAAIQSILSWQQKDHAAQTYDAAHNSHGTIRPLRPFGMGDAAQAIGEGAADTVGALPDLYTLANNLLVKGAEKGSNLAVDAGQATGVLPKDWPRADLSGGIITDPWGGSQRIKELAASLSRATGHEPLSKWDLTPSGRTAYDTTEAVSQALPLSRGTAAAKEIATLAPLDFAKAQMGYAKALPAVSGAEFAQDMAGAVGAGVGQSVAENQGPKINPLAEAAIVLAGAHGGSATASLALKPAETATAIKRALTIDRSIPEPSARQLSLMGDERRGALFENKPTQADVDDAARVLQTAALNPDQAASRLRERSGDAATLGDTLPDSFSVSGDEGLISVGRALRSGAHASPGAPVPAVFAGLDRKLADANRQDVESLRVPNADQRAPQQLAENERTLRTDAAAADRDKAEADYEAARGDAVNQGTVLASKAGTAGTASEEADRVLKATLERDQAKRSKLYDLGERASLEAADATPLKVAQDSVIRDAMQGPPSTQKNALPSSVSEDLASIFKDVESGERPAPSAEELAGILKDAEARGAAGDNVVPLNTTAKPSNVTQLRPTEATSGKVVPLEPRQAKNLDAGLLDVMNDPANAAPEDANAALEHMRGKFKAQADRSPALTDAVQQTVDHLDSGDMHPDEAISSGRAKLTDPEDQRVFDSLTELWKSPDDSPQSVSKAMRAYYGDAVTSPPETPNLDAMAADGKPRATIRQLQDMRTNASMEERAARDKADFGQVDRIRTIKQGIDSTIDQFITDNPKSRAAKQLKAAKAYDQTDFGVWLHGAGDDYRKAVNASPEFRDKSPPSATLDYFIKGGAKGTKEMSADLAAIGDRVTDPAKLKGAVRDYLLSSAAQSVRPDGTISSTALRAWRNKYGPALSQWPDLNDEFKALANNATSTDAKVSSLAKDMRDKREAFAGTDRDIKQMALAPFLDTEPKKAVASILNGPDPEVQMRKVLQRIGKDTNARDGLKDAISEHLYDMVTGSNAAAGTEGVAVSASKMLNTMDRYGKVLRQVYEPQDMQMIERLQRTLRDMQATSVRAGSGSDTVDRMASIKTSAELLFKLKDGALEGASQFRRFKLMLGALPGANSKDKINRVLLSAAFDPDLAAMLLQRPPQPKGLKLFASQVSDRMATLRGAQQAVQADDQQEVDSGYAGSPAEQAPAVTTLNPTQEKAYQAWISKIGMTKARGMAMTDDGTGTDYDMRGFFKKYGPANVDVEGGQHFTDEFKLPNHPTFSNESIYAKGANRSLAGHWEGDKYVPPAKR